MIIMNEANMRELYIDLTDIKTLLIDLKEYNKYVKSEIKTNFKIDNNMVEKEKFNNYRDSIKNVKEVLTNEIIPDVKSKM